MDHKTWPWRKRASEKTIVANNKADLSLKGNGEEVLLNEKEIELERSVKSLNERLATALSNCSAKDELVANHAQMAQEAVSGREKAEAEVVSLKQELDAALQQGIGANERLTHLNTALKDCMQQLCSVREDQEQRIRDAVMKTSRELEKAHKMLEEKLAETSRRLANSTAENSQLSKVLLVKDKLIEDLSLCRTRTEADLRTLMTRLDSTEKENAFLKYEFHMLEKELEIRNEEMEFTRQSADASHKQNLESLKKITKLEEECQRLRVLVRKRLPGPAALAKMKTQVEIQEKNHLDTRRRKLNRMTGDLVVRDCSIEKLAEIPSRRISLLIGRLSDIEEENKILKEVLARKDDELRSSRIMCAKTASKLSQIEAQIGQLENDQKPMELALFNPIPNESSNDIRNNDGIGNSALWASALISELEHVRCLEAKNTYEHKSIGVSEMSLMDDFAEMERLAIVAVDAPPETSYATSDVSHLTSESLRKEQCEDHSNSMGKELVPVTPTSESFHKEQCEDHSDSMGKELVPVTQGEPSDMDQKLRTTGHKKNWVADVLKVILEQNRVSKRSINELLDDVRIAVHNTSQPSASEAYGAESLKHPESSELLPISGYITWRSPHTSPRADSIGGISHSDISVKTVDNQSLQSNLNQSISKIIELIRKFVPACSKDCHMSNNRSERDKNPCKDSMTPGDYQLYLCKWKSCELSSELEQFSHACNDILDGNVNFEKFAMQLSSALGWITDNCIGFEDASVLNKVLKGQSSFFPLVTTASERYFMPEAVKNQYESQQENTGLTNEFKSISNFHDNFEMRQQLANNNSEVLITKLHESERKITRLQNELETLKETKTLIEDQMENQKTTNEDLDTQITVTKVKLNEVLQKLSSLEVELEDRNHCCEELESTCLELQLQLQLESVANKETPNATMEQDEGERQTGWEITAASAKLAECQETIFNLGRQFKSLASSKEAAIFDKVISATTVSKKTLSLRSSLRDQMLAEDNARAHKEDTEYQKTKERTKAMEIKRPTVLQPNSCNTLCIPDAQMTPVAPYIGSKHEAKTAAFAALAIVPSNKRGRISLLRKLLFRRKRWVAKKTSVSIATVNCAP